MELIKKSNGKSTLIISDKDNKDNIEKQKFSMVDHIIDHIISINIKDFELLKSQDWFRKIILPNTTPSTKYELILTGTNDYEELIKGIKIDVLGLTCGDCACWLGEGICGDKHFKSKDIFVNTPACKHFISKENNTKYISSPIKTDPTNPLQPRKEWDKKRLDNITCSILRKFEENQVIPVEWFEEYNELVSGGVK